MRHGKIAIPVRRSHRSRRKSRERRIRLRYKRGRIIRWQAVVHPRHEAMGIMR